MDIRAYNRAAWDRNVEQGNQWTVPVSEQIIAAARRGEWEIVVTPTKAVPRDWFPELQGADVLCLASGGGQQGPVLAAAGARVIVLDNSPRQLEQDRIVAERESLSLTTVEGDMADLSMFSDKSFDLIFHPVSNCFVPEVLPVWRQAYRVLRPGGVLLAGFNNPITYAIDFELAERTGRLQIKYSLPYSDLTSLNDEQRQHFIDEGAPMEFGHTLQDQIGGQLQAGFVLTGFYEDHFAEEVGDPLSQYMDTFIATRAIKPT